MEIKNTILRNQYSKESEIKSPLNLLLWNIRTINDIKLRKLTEIINFMASDEVGKDEKNKNKFNHAVIDVIVLVEYGKMQSKFNTFNMKGYKFYSALRSERKGGGIALYVKDNINVNIKFSKITKDFEMLHTELFKHNE
ncbi:hypothetical protein ACKWTF_011802 [Chironomus riparius]